MARITECPKCQTKTKISTEIGQYCPNRDCDVIEVYDPVKFAHKDRYNIYTRESVVQECIDIILSKTNRCGKQYYANLLKKHFSV